MGRTVVRSDLGPVAAGHGLALAVTGKTLGDTERQVKWRDSLRVHRPVRGLLAWYLAGATAAVFNVKLNKGPARLDTWLTMPNGKTRGAYFVDVNYLGK